MLTFRLDDAVLSLHADEAPWDSRAFGFPVVEIKHLFLKDDSPSPAVFDGFLSWAQSNRIGLISCRLRGDQLAESFFLENHQFKFIEMVLSPEASLKNSTTYGALDSICVTFASESDIPSIRSIALEAFSLERCHIDPYLSLESANIRYGNWVEACLGHPTQRLLKFTVDGFLVGFFIVEELPFQTVYWHLTAICPKLQGLGFGRRVWRAMLEYHARRGVNCVRTCISARNTRVINLYASLGFKFSSPKMTFHLHTRFS